MALILPKEQLQEGPAQECFPAGHSYHPHPRSCRQCEEGERLYWGEKEKALIHSAVFLGVSNSAQSITHSLRSGTPPSTLDPSCPNPLNKIEDTS